MDMAEHRKDVWGKIGPVDAVGHHGPERPAWGGGGVTMNDKVSSNYMELTADIVSAYVSNNSVAAGDISSIISQVHQALMRVSNGQSETSGEPAKPAIAVKKSITPDYI